MRSETADLDARFTPPFILAAWQWEVKPNAKSHHRTAKALPSQTLATSLAVPLDDSGSPRVISLLRRLAQSFPRDAMNAIDRRVLRDHTPFSPECAKLYTEDNLRKEKHGGRPAKEDNR